MRIPRIMPTLLAAVLLSAVAVCASAQDQMTPWHNHPECKGSVAAILQKFEAANLNIHVELQEIPIPPTRHA